MDEDGIDYAAEQRAADIAILTAAADAIDASTDLTTLPEAMELEYGLIVSVNSIYMQGITATIETDLAAALTRWATLARAKVTEMEAEAS